MKNIVHFKDVDGRIHLSEPGHRTLNERAAPINLASLAARARHAVLLTSLSACAGLGGLPTARAKEAVKLAISKDAGTAVTQMDKTLPAPESSFTARTERVYLDETGQPLHILQTMNVVMHRPDRLKIEVARDDSSHDLSTMESRFRSSRPTNSYAVLAAPGDTSDSSIQI